MTGNTCLSNQTMLYADDTSLKCKNKNKNKIKNKKVTNFEIQTNIQVLSILQYFKVNILNVNADWLIWLDFTPLKTYHFDHPVFVDNKLISKANSVKFLELIVDLKLRWDDYVK